MNFPEVVFSEILDMSITASYVILAVCAVRLLLKRAPKIFSYALWSVVGFRLVCPVSFASVISIFSVRALLSPQSRGGVSTAPQSFNDGNLITAPQSLVSPVFTNSRQTTAAEAQSVGPTQTLFTIALMIWLAGMAVMIAYSVISYLKIRHGVKQAVRLKGNVYECDGIRSPFVLGIVKPRIYIPFRMDEKEKACILCHERQHIRRLDHVIKPLAFFILSVYWFHPLVWLSYVFMCRDMEMSCDEKVVSIMGTEAKRDYSLSLLSVGTNRRLSVGGTLFFGETGVKTRVNNVLHMNKPKVWAVILAALLCIVVVAACAADPKTEKTADATPSVKPVIESTGSPEAAESDDTYDISGRYEFEDNIYTNPLSSFMAVKGHMPTFDITEKSLRIVNQENDTVEEYAGAAAPVDISKDDFDALFEDAIVLEGMIPDISQYERCTQYAVYTDEVNRLEFRLYLMDDEVWLVRMGSRSIWSIYRLVRTGGVSESFVGGIDGPQNVVMDGMMLEICNGKDVWESVTLTDSESQNIVKNIITQYESDGERADNTDIFQVGDYFRLIDTDGAIYYVFHNGEEPRIQSMKEGNSQAALPQPQYETLFALWESHMSLPATASVNFCGAEITPLVYRAGSVPALRDIKDQISYITVDDQDSSMLQVFIDGSIVHDRYEVCNADTLEQLELLEPSGVYQETIVAAMLKTAEPGQSFIIKLSTGYATEDKIYGYTVVFGAVKS